MGLEILTLHRKASGVRAEGQSISVIGESDWEKHKNTWRLALLLLVFLAYLCAGSLVFRAIEAPGEDVSGLELRNTLQKFVADHGLKTSELQDLIDKVVQASDKGIKIGRNLSLTNNWGFGQSFFFAGTLLTTVGYGHVSPVTQFGKAFTIIYCLLGIPAFLVLLSVIVECLRYPSHLFLGTLQDRFAGLYGPSCIQWLHLSSMFALFFAFMFVLPATLFMSIEKDWTFLDAFYYCFISLTTIGLGDYIPGDKVDQPHRSIYKIFTTGYLIIGIICMMVFLAVVYDMPQLNFTRLFLNKEKNDEHAYLASKHSLATGSYTRQIDEVSPSATSASDPIGSAPIDDSYHY